MTIDVYPPTAATEIEWIKVIDYSGAPRTATDLPEQTIVRVHLPTGETVRVVVPERK